MISFVIAAIVLASDQVTKNLINESLLLFESKPVVDGFIYITLVHNTGAAFGILRGNMPLFIMMALTMTVVIIIYYRKLVQGSTWNMVALGLFVGGSLGNLTDRIFRGYVVDFLDVQIWPIFNIADTAITIGVIMYICKLLFSRGNEQNEDTV